MIGWLHAHDGHVALAQVLVWLLCVAAAGPSLLAAWRDLPVGHRRAIAGVGLAAAVISLAFPLGRFDPLGHEADYYECFTGRQSPSNAHGYKAYVSYPILRWGYWVIGRIVGQDSGPVPLMAVNAIARGIGVFAFGWLAAALARRSEVGVAAGVLLALHPIHAFWGAAFFHVAIPWTGMAVCLLLSVLAWRTGEMCLLLAAAASGCMVVSVRVEWGLLAPCLALLLFGGLGARWGRHARVRTPGFWIAPLALVALWVPSLLASGGAITEQGGYHDASGYLASIGRQGLWVAVFAPWHWPWMGALVAFGLHRWGSDPDVGWRGPASLIGFVLLGHIGLATFNDYGYRHALLPTIAVLLGASFAASALLEEGRTRAVAAVLGGTAVLTSLVGLADAWTRYYASEEAFMERVPGFQGAELPAAKLEDGTCYLVTDNERLWSMGLSGSHFNLMDPGEAVWHWREHDGCVLWLLDRSQWRWDSLGPRDRADKLRYWFSWEPRGWVTFQDRMTAVVFRMTEPPWGIADDMPLPESEFLLHREGGEEEESEGAPPIDEPDAPEEVGGEEERAVESAP
ncbi:MAG: hypothetical protein GY898_23940 [Proteobacteria bacterium]|nr:hypothetical protein [Pseudomonadota bacterium]